MTSYSTVQKQQLSQLGAYLQEKRQEQGKSLEDISLQTYIRAQLLKSVESGDTTDLPQPIFVQGFIRRYADALGLDGSNFAKQFPVHSIPNTPRPNPRPATQINIPTNKNSAKPPTLAQTNSIPPKEPPLVGALPVQQEPPGTPPKSVPTSSKAFNGPSSIKTDVDARGTFELDPTPMDDSRLNALGFTKPLGAEPNEPNAPVTKPELGLSSPPVESPDLGSSTSWTPSMGSSSGGSSTPWMSWLPWGIGTAVAVGAIALIVPRFMGNGPEQPTAPVQAEAPETETVIQTEAPPPVPEPEPVVNRAPVSVEVEVTEAGPSWMSVNVDGEIVFEGLLNPGAQESWEGQESITMNVGNAGAALISANGSEPSPAGNPGGAEFLSFTAEE